MTTYITELLQDVLKGKEDYRYLAEIIKDYVMKNSEDKYSYIVDAIQVSILQYTNKFLSYQECETIYFAIKGFQSLYL